MPRGLGCGETGTRTLLRQGRLEPMVSSLYGGAILEDDSARKSIRLSHEPIRFLLLPSPLVNSSQVVLSCYSMFVKWTFDEQQVIGWPIKIDWERDMNRNGIDGGGVSISLSFDTPKARATNERRDAENTLKKHTLAERQRQARDGKKDDKKER